MIYRFNVLVITDKVLNNDDKSEVMEAIKSQIGRIKKAGGHFLHESEIQVTREVSLNDIAEAIGVSTSNTDPVDSQTSENCAYYDEAQGRHNCTNDLVKSDECNGVCKFYWSKNKQS